MGEVVLAHDDRLDRLVAIKRLHADHAVTADRRERFRREARITAQVNHPAIVQVHDVLHEGDHDYLIMEYVDGRPVAIAAFDFTVLGGSNGAVGTGYDTVICSNVLEHIEDDVRALRNIRTLLKPGGRLLLYVPATPRLYCAIDRHVGHHAAADGPP